ncbi:hypothetical protein GALMADRAFT_283987 [Galerina marginata CBS 339.88]|uniref:Protein kinase domain-containing protein n=1 Tax=Galerina marginata (strain CBS 339.88) TaxID=685588 RepID=A0A067SHC0_GALM3|nr:hypothetical protein GALMADRAFT_283987 [Galerina marginata CBS 339.88]
MLPISDPFYPRLKEILEANYDAGIVLDLERLEGVSTSPRSPQMFYDRHIMPSLVLQNVVYLPSITQSLSKACDNAIQGFLHDGHKLSSNGYVFSRNTRSKEFRDAHSVSFYYGEYIARICHAFASKVCLHPQCDTWKSVFKFTERPTGQPFDFTTQSWLEVTTRRLDGSLSLHDDLQNCLPDATKTKILDLSRKFPRLATWHMFAMTDAAMSMFQTMKEGAAFIWQYSHTMGAVSMSHKQPPPDAKHALSFLPLKAPTKAKPRQPLPPTKRSVKSKLVTPTKFAVKRNRYRPDFRHFLQSAWANAAMYDSTYIILNCGRYERIGIRHRESQTLYLSGLIDTVNIQDPRYRKLHLGLHVAIVKDALERQERVNARNVGQKHSSEHLEEEETTDFTQRKKNCQSKLHEPHRISEELARRQLALVSLDYGAFRSYVPSSFSRVAPSCAPGLSEEAGKHKMKAKYRCHEYISLTLKEPLGRGAVGVVHPVMLELVLESGEIMTQDFTFKLAFSVEQMEKLYHEFQIYQQLSKQEDVEGIVTVHGLFKDQESRTLAMLMSDGGVSLRRREMERSGDAVQVVTTSEEKDSFLRALNSIHRAGIRHHDIRADNLLVNSDGQVFIIDFDCADNNVYDDKIEQELICMNAVLEGRYQEKNYYP